MLHRPRGGGAPRRVSPLSGKKGRCHTAMVIGQSGDHNLLQIEIHHIRLVENFISFPKSPRSSKSEFGARSYARNTKGCCCCFWARCRRWRCTLPRVAVYRPWGGGATILGCPVHTAKGGATPRLGFALATSLVAFSDSRTTQTYSFLLLFFSKLIQIYSNNFSFANVPTPPSVQHHVQVC